MQPSAPERSLGPADFDESNVGPGVQHPHSPTKKEKPLTQFLGRVFGCGCMRRPVVKTVDQLRQERTPLSANDSNIRELEYPPDTRSTIKRPWCGAPSSMSPPWICGLSLVLLLVVGLVLAAITALASHFGASGGGAPGPGGPTRVRITNGCKSEAMWVSHLGADGFDPQNIRIPPLGSHDFRIPDEGLGQTRYWTKWRCMEGGVACGIGDSGGPGQTCDRHAGCAPPIDTKFAAVFGIKGKPCNTSAQQFEGCDFVDVSVTDGYTVPFELEIKGDCRGTMPKDVDKIHQVVTCVDLSSKQCPAHEDLGDAGADVDLRAINPHWGTYAGCYSPCSKLTLGPWTRGRGNATQRQLPRQEGGGANAFYCCPAEHVCRASPIGGTGYVRGVQAVCPGVNAYAYDRGLAIGTCPAGTRYEMIFYCPPDADS